MTQNEINNIRSQMRKGMLEYCILLKLSTGKYYPSDILNALKEADMIVVEGTLYTLLNRLRREGKLDYEWQESPKGPPRKYYYMTDAGREVLRVMSESWQEICATVSHFATTKQNENK
ncbi:MAG: PadR family transcriptional regulator [Clostridium sp.]|nr:PadR family transcriptional regulator [Prevotella sp.]MCM1428735.1 PadR family transcriptional regulator [Clostridium sp.]MCM1475110.1 PadR family transcriptional regulator [Muribaculaceae bacterium]